MRRFLLSGILVAIVTTVPAISRADDDGPRPTPRSWVKIGDASVVLIAAGDKLYAFVDRLEDNSPIEDADLSVESADGSSITMDRAPLTANKATAGVFVGKLERASHMQDAFMVTLNSSAGSGQEPVEIIYTDTEDKPPVASPPSNQMKIAVALVSGAIGAIGAVQVMFWWRGGGRRAPAVPPAAARVA